MEVCGQAASGGTTSPLTSLMEMLGTGGSSYSSSDMLTQMLGSFLGGEVSGISGLSYDNTGLVVAYYHESTDL